MNIIKKLNKKKVVLLIGFSILGLFLISLLVPVSKKTLFEKLGFSYEIYDCNGILLRKGLSTKGYYYSPVKLDELPDFLKDALLIAEDKRFYFHAGIDLPSLFAAFIRNIFYKNRKYGASTINMQIARNVHNLSRNIFSKLYEMWLAIRLDVSYSKDELMEIYFNTIPFGKQIIGVRAAARIYFDKEPMMLSKGECAFLIALLKYPTYIKEKRHIKKILIRQKYILKKLYHVNVISKASFEIAAGENINPKLKKGNYLAPHFTDFIIKYVKRHYKDNLERIAKIYTTFDYNIYLNAYKKAKYAISTLTDKRAGNASVIVIDNRNASLLAMVGSVNYFTDENSGQVNGTTALRSPGSTLKPFVYATGIDEGLFTAATVIPDIKTYIRAVSGDYTPINDNRDFRGPITLRKALGCSYNIPAARAIEAVSVSRVLSRLRKAGFSALRKKASHYGASLALGGADVSLFQLARAYAAFANNGVFREVKVINKVVDINGKDITLGSRNREKRIFSKQTSFIISNILSDNDARQDNFTLMSPLNLPFYCAAKTGTSKGFRNNWTLGYSKNYTVGVWVGNFNNTPMRGLGGVAGAGNIFRHIMLSLENDYNFRPDVPKNIVKRMICSKSGLLATSDCDNKIAEYFIKGSEPVKKCNIHVAIPFFKNTKSVAKHIKSSFRNVRIKNIEWRIMLILPPVYNQWLKDKGFSIPGGDVISYAMNSRDRNKIAVSSVQILFPDNRDVFAIDPIVRREFQVITFRADFNDAVKLITWQLNNKVIVSRSYPFSVNWKLKRGKYHLRAKALLVSGRIIKSRVTRFTVK